MGSRIWFLVGMEVSMNQIVKVLMERDGYTKKEAEIRLKEARMEFDPTTDDPEEFLAEEFGLELDYVFDFLGY